jgi:hypothetical protein
MWGKKKTSEIKWYGIGPATFKSRLEFTARFPNDTSFAFRSGRAGLGCVRCHNVELLPTCSNCENTQFVLGLSSGRPGLFCTKCRAGFTTWSCGCGASNPVTHETLLVQG